MRGRFAALPLRRQLVLAILLLVVPLLAAVIWSGSLSFRERGNELGDEARNIARTVAAVIDRDPQRRDDVFGVVPVPPGAVVAIATTDGVILSRRGAEPPPPGTRLPGPSRLGVLLPFRSLDPDGVERVYGEAPTASGPWIVSVGLPMSLALERARTLWSRSLTILAFAVGSWLFVALLLSNRLVSAVGYLDRTAQRIASGDFSPLPQKRLFARELTELHEAFESMLRQFNATRDALDAQAAEERRIRKELESLQGQVIRQERLAAVGQLVSGVAHEINNPLQAISGFAELLQLQRDLPPPVQNDLNVILRESARACAIIRNLALFARQQAGPVAAIQLTEVIAAVAELRQRRLESEQIELRIDDASTQAVTAVLTELQQVVLNFVVNAEQAILTSGRIPGRVTIRTYDRDSWAVLEVEDTGPGVRPEDEPRLFEPFFTTKPVGQGTGLGLSISYGIIESLGGRVGYRSAPARGAIFFFELPAAVFTSRSDQMPKDLSTGA